MAKSKDKFKFLEHTADIEFQAFGKTKEKLFENSALAMAEAMSSERCRPTIKKKIKVSGKDNESLMYNFLEELLFLFDSEHFYLGNAKVKINNNELVAELEGDKAENYDITIDIKAVTYNDMFVKEDKENKQWISQVVLDV